MPHDKTVRLYRALAAGNTPGPLSDGELALDALSDPPRLYTPVPTSRVPSGVLDLLKFPGIENAPFLPLRGGTLDTLTDATDGTSGLGLTIANNDTSGNRAALTINNNQNSPGLFIITSGFGNGIDLRGGGAGNALNIVSPAGAHGIYVANNANFVGTAGIWVNALQTTVGPGICILNGSNVADSVGLDVRAPTWAMAAHGVQINNTGSGASLILQRLPTAITPINTRLGDISFRGRRQTGARTTGWEGAAISGVSTEAWSATANGTRLDFQVTPNGTVGPQTAMTIDQSRIVSVWDGTQMVALPGAAGVSQADFDALAARCARLEQIVEFYIWRSQPLPPMPTAAPLDHPGNGNGNGSGHSKRRRKNGGGS